LPLRIDYDIILVAYKKDTQSQTQLTEEWTVSSWIVKKEEIHRIVRNSKKRGEWGVGIQTTCSSELDSRGKQFQEQHTSPKKKARNRRGNGRFGLFKGDI
jgi:hypothetical protein